MKYRPVFGIISYCPRRDNSVRLKIKHHVARLKVLVVPEHSCVTKIKKENVERKFKKTRKLILHREKCIFRSNKNFQKVFFLHTRHSLKIANSVLTGQNAYYQFKYTSTIKLSYIGVVKV